jgi:hypothetical protein
MSADRKAHAYVIFSIKFIQVLSVCIRDIRMSRCNFVRILIAVRSRLRKGTSGAPQWSGDDSRCALCFV